MAAQADSVASHPEPPSRSAEATTRSFETFFATQHTRLFAAMTAVSGNRQEAEEIMQEAFLKLWERWDRVSRLDDPEGYLYRTAMNVFRGRYRRAKLALRKAVGTVERTDAFEAVEARRTVIKGLAALTPSQRAAIVFTSLLGYSSEEAGEILGTSASAVRTLSTTGRARMRAAAGEDA